jgi:hypothetical protein
MSFTSWDSPTDTWDNPTDTWDHLGVAPVGSFVPPVTVYIGTMNGVGDIGDVSAYLSGTINVTRGRSREVDQYTAGTASFTLRNESRLFDPSNTASPLYPGILPRLPVTITLAGNTIFGGFVDDIQVNYEIPNICTVDVTCIDAFTCLANSFLQNRTPAAEPSGTRIFHILGYAEVDPAAGHFGTSLDTGQITVCSRTFDQVDALSTCQSMAVAEQGFFFCDCNGVLQYHDRYWNTRLLVLAVTFSDLPADITNGAIAYQGITQGSQALLLYNLVTGTSYVPGSTLQQVGDAPSQAQFGVRTLQMGSLETNSLYDTSDLIQWMLNRYSQPEIRFATVTVELQSLDPARLAAVTALDLGSVVTVRRTPGGTGTPATITKVEQVDQIVYALDVSNSTYTLTLTFSLFDPRSYFTLDSAVLGVLDVNQLGA